MIGFERLINPGGIAVAGANANTASAPSEERSR
jgi:hypothetical protein